MASRSNVRLRVRPVTLVVAVFVVVVLVARIGPENDEGRPMGGLLQCAEEDSNLHGIISH